MALIIRLRQMGRNNQQTYRVVVTNVRTRRDGRYVEAIGWYNPQNDTDHLHVEADRVLHWFNLGAMISENVMQLIEKASPETAQAIMLKQELKTLKDKKTRRARRAKLTAGSKAAAPKATASKAAPKKTAAKKTPKKTVDKE